ncbi:MAG: phosphoribosylanthranilate isomerase [Rhodocyclaceae bacterium]|nr:phosphoribosylanthranilate isomerase [Rhodocyclaceae bacterium]
MRTRIKICGITREEDLAAAVYHGADAIGFVFYPKSPRYLAPAAAAQLARQTPPFVARVGLFVNAERHEIAAILAQTPLDLLQFHGDEEEADCLGFDRPYLKAARMRPGFDLLEFARRFPAASGLVLDAWVEGYGGGGKTFDWSLIPAGLPKPIILSGGLDAANVGQAIHQVRPWAVDVSSGVERAKGVKSEEKIAAFCAAVRMADEQARGDAP